MKSFNRRATFIIATIILLALGTAGYGSTLGTWQETLAGFFGFETPVTESQARTAAEASNMFFTAGICDTAGPIEVESATGTLGGTPTAYATLGAAFTAINGGSLHTGAISIDVCANSTELATATLNQTAGVGNITISPAGGAGRTISGSIAGPLIDLNGADNVTIDGLNSGGNSLTLSNTNNGATAATSTIRFINDATSNTIQNSTISGSSTLITTGTIFFSTTSGAAGNDTNIINNNNIGPAGSNLPFNAIYASGTSTTTATNNSGVQITNNKIFDFFNAAAASNGINIAGGNTDWTITGNGLYQTATRTATAGATHIGILINNTAGNNFAVSNNVIGGSDNTAGGTAWTIAGAFTNRFQGIQMNVGTTTASSVQGNTVKNFSWTSTSGATTLPGIWIGIYVLAGAVNVGTTTGNTIGATTGTGSVTAQISTTGGISFGIGSGSSGTVAISNNNIGAITVTGTTTGISHSFAGIQTTAGTNTISGNTIGSTTTANSINASTASTSTTGGHVVGILSSSSTSTTATNNTIANLNNAYAGSGTTTFPGQIRGIAVTAGVTTITGNTVRNLSTASSVTSGTSGAAAVGIVANGAIAGMTISQNTVHSISATPGTASAAHSITGIFYQATNSGTNIVERNFVHSLSTTSTGAAVLNGIYTFNGNTTFRNNMIRLGIDAAGGSVASGALAINGFQSDTTGSHINNYYFNSVYIGGSSVTTGTAATNAFKRITSDTTDLRDNILVNNRSNSTGTGKHYLINIAANTTFTSNYNVFHQTGTGAVFGVVNTTDSAAFANWKTNTSQDANSFFSDPQFLVPTGTSATVDLHINPSVTTLVEANGILISPPTDDFDGQTRSTLTPVDIGADAGNFTGVDLTPPVISYTALTNNTNTTSRVLTISVTDVSGVPTSGVGRPTLYYRKGTSGAYTPATCVFTAGSSYDCTFTYASVGGVIAGDTIQYYVAAQDGAATPNVTTNPATGASGFTANPPAATTPTTAPNSFVIAASVSGTKTVCASGCDYTTLTGAAGIFNAINTGVATGNIEIQINGDLTTGEDGTNGLNQLAEEPAGSNFTVKIYPTGTTRNITGSNAGGLIRLNGADRITIDGSIGGTGTDRSLNITQTNTGVSSAVVWLQSTGSNGATNNAVRNVNILGNSNITTLIGLGSGSSTISITSTGAGNNSNTFQNNNVSKTQYGIFSGGTSAAAKNTGNAITQNLVNAASPNNVQIGGIYVIFESGVNISNNNVAHVVTSTSVTPAFGISLGLRNSNIFSGFTGSEVVGATVSGNIVDDIVRTGDGSAFGIGVAEVTTAASAANTFTNNAVTRVRSTASTPSDFPTGMLMGGGTGSNTKLYHNSVSASGVCSSSSPCFAVVLAGSNPLMDVKNNAFYNIQTSTSGKIYAIGTTSSTFTNLTSDYNLYFTNSANFAVTGGLAGTDRTFAAFKTTTGQDANSLNVDPLFNSVSNVQPQTGSPLVGAGINTTGVTADIVGITRATGIPPAGPTIGAYENALDTAGPVITYTAFGNTTSTSDRTLSITVTDTSGVPTSGAGLPVLYFRKGTSGAYSSNQCTFVSGSSYNCSTNYTAVGGVATSDTIQYFVAAQDSVGNVSANPSGGAGGFTPNPPTAGTPPTTPNSYLIAVSYTGTATVDAGGGGGAFTSLTNPGGLFQALNNGALTGNLTVNITSDLTGETGSIPLNQLAEEGAGAGTYTVTIKPSGAARSITSTATAAGVIGLFGADRVTIDGSLSGGTDRSLTIINSNATTSGTSVVAVYSLGVGAGATNNTIKNCVIQNGTKFDASTTSFNFGIYVGGNGVAAGPDNDNLTIQNNLVQRANTGMQITGGASPGALDNLVVSDNTVGGAVAADFIGLNGMIIGNATGANITRNTVRNHLFTAALDGGGIFLSAGFVNSSVTRNTVTNLESSNSGGYGMTGIYIATGNAASNDTIANNFVSDIRGTSWTTAVLGDTVAGIRVAGTSTGGINIHNNSVNLFGNYAGANAATVTAAFMVNGTTPSALNVRNNIFVNSFNNSTVTTDKNYAIYTSSANTMFSGVNFNDYFVSGAQGVLGAINSVDATTFTALQTATGGDGNSINADPLYATTTDLHIQSGSPARNTGTTIATVTDDYDGNTRPQESVYDIGADEYVDATAPDTTIDSNPPNPSNSSSATFTFSGTDSLAPEALASFECDLDGGGFSACTSPQTYNSLSDGSHTFQVRAKDAGGNVDPSPASYTWVVDTIAPTIVPDPPFQEPYTNSTSSTFTFHGTDSGSGIAGFICSLDGAPFAPCTSPVTYSGLSVGLHTHDVKAVDAAGNLSVANYSSVWEIDQTPPDTFIDSNPPSQSSSSSATFTFHGTDTPVSPPNPMGPGLTFQCSLDSTPFTSCTSPQNFSGLSDGSHTFEVRTIDRAGNVDPTPASYTWVVDTAAPDTSILTNPANPTNSNSATFTFNGSDSGTGVASFECDLDGGGFTACTSGVNYPGLSDGSHTFQVRAKDGVNNTDASPAIYTWVIDTAAPQTQIDTFPANPTSDTSAAFTFSGTDPGGSGVAGFECQIDGQGFNPCNSGTLNISGLNNATHTVEIRAKDAAGNVDSTPATYSWLVDTEPPVTDIDSTPANPTASSSATFTFHGTDLGGGSGVGGFDCQLDGGGFSACTSGINYPSLSDGSHTFEVRAKDVLGNTDQSPASFTWVIDTTAPDTGILTNPANPTNSVSATFTFNGSDAGTGVASFECDLDGGGFSTCTSGVNYPGLSDGSHTFQVRAKDFVNNTDPSPASYTWVVDTIAPDTSILTNPANPTNSASATFTFNGNDGSGVGVAGFECDLDGGGFTTCASGVNYPGLGNGSHTFQVRAKDGANNTDASPASYTWVIDTVAPDTSIDSNPSDPTNNSSATFTFSGTDSFAPAKQAKQPEVIGITFECQLDGGGYTPCTSGVSYPSLADGSHTFDVRAKDPAGNTDLSPASFTWLIDTTPPDTSITGSPNDPTNGTSATFNFNGNDGSGVGVAGFECDLDGGGYGPCTSGVNYTSLAAGSHTFNVRAKDSLNNTDASPASFTWTIDLASPVIANYTPLASTSSSSPRTQTVTVTDNLAVASVTLNYSINGGAYTPLTCTLSGIDTYDCVIPGQAFGTAVAYYVTAADTANNNATPNPAPATPNLYSVGTATIPAGTYNYMSLSSGSTLGGNATVLDTFNISGVVETGSNTLTIACGGTITGANSSSYVVGNLQKDFCGTGTFTYPVGTIPNGTARGNDKERDPEGVSEYSPATVTVNSGTFPSSLKISVVDTWLTGLGQTSSISRYWDVTETGDLNANITFQYLDEDIYGTETSYNVFRRSGGFTNQYITGSVNAGANTFTAGNVTTFSQWGAGVSAPTAATADVSGRVLTADGRPIANVRVIISGPSLPEPIDAYTGHLGYYGFADLPVGQNYVVTVKSRRFMFSNPSHLITLNNDITDGDFVANPQE